MLKKAPRISGEMINKTDLGAEMTLRLFIEDPEIWVIDKFLTDDECDTIVKKYTEGTYALGYVSNDGTIETNGRRKAKGQLIKSDDPLGDIIEKRLELLTQWPILKSEALNFVHYQSGDFIKPHFDFLGTNQHMGPGGQRIGTAVIYLNDTEMDGPTAFVDAGIKIYPKKGCLLLFNYPDPTVTSKTKHCSEDLKSGDKYVLVKWFRENFNI